MKRSIAKPLILIVLAAVIAAGYLAYRSITTPRGFAAVAPGVLCRSRQPRGWQWGVLKRHGI